jgi:hypothetical protein
MNLCDRILRGGRGLEERGTTSLSTTKLSSLGHATSFRGIEAMILFTREEVTRTFTSFCMHKGAGCVS